MADKKRASRDGARNARKRKAASSSGTGAESAKRRGPRLPSQFRKALDAMRKPAGGSSDSDADEGFDSDHQVGDVYEYEEGVAQEDSRKNRRFDLVDNLEYEMPQDFKDENVTSDDEDMSGDEAEEEEEEERHLRVLEGVTGVPGEVFQGRKKKKNEVITEAYPESEFNPSRDVLDGSGQITITSLLAPLQGISGFGNLKKRINKLEREVVATQAPLHKAERERLERRAAYDHTRKDLFKWEPLIKRNREVSTMIFDNDVDLGFSTVGAITSAFEPRTEFEKKMASLVCDDKIVGAYREDGSRLLELNQVSVEDERDRRDRIAKMRSLLFRHEMKAKHIKKIKSKTYHRLLKKDKLKAASAEKQMDPEAAKELANKHEFERAKERMTLRHRSSSKWAQRIKERGLNAQDEGTRAAIAEKDQLHNALTRKMRSMRDSSSSSEESGGDDESDYDSAGSDQGRASRLIAEAKEKTLKVLNEDDEAPKEGLLSLPFMVRGMRKRNEAAAEEAKLALEDFDSLEKQLEGSNGADSPKSGVSRGRMVFNAVGKRASKPSKTKAENKTESDNFYDDSNSENDIEADDNDDGEDNGSGDLANEVNVGENLLNEASEANQNGFLKSFDDIVKEPGPKTTHEVAIFASGAWKKVKGGSNDASKEKPPAAKKPVSKNQVQEIDKDSGDEIDSDSEIEMVDGILSSGPKASYKLPSQDELIRQAFAGDDVEDGFEKHKQDILNEENPEPEKPVLLPGWGQWTHIQKKRGLPAWMVNEHETAKKKREEAIKKRKDAKLKHVIISEKLDKRAEKLYTKTLPFPHTSKEVFEQSIRMPMGPEFNPATAFGALNRPEVLKKPGHIIKPLEFEEVNPHEKGEMIKHGGLVDKKSKKSKKQKQKQKGKANKNKSQS